MPSDRQQLLEFGFAPSLVDAALRATGESGLQAALDWLDEHPDGQSSDDKGKGSLSSGPDKDDAIKAKGETIDLPGRGEGGDPESVPEGFRKSLKCSECEKTFSTLELAQLHASKTGHDDFSEAVVRALTDAEKADRLEELRSKMLAKRAAEEEQTAEEHRQAELLRRKAGRQNDDLKREREKKEIEKLQKEQRAEQEAAQQAKQRVLEMIEEDRRERERRAALTRTVQEAPAPEETADRPLSLASPPAGDTARVQVKLADGRALKYTMGSSEPLAALIDRITADVPQLGQHKLILMPGHRLLTAVDHNFTLAHLGLSPSATLMLQ